MHALGNLSTADEGTLRGPGEGEDIVYGLEDPKVQGFEFCSGEGTPELESELEEVREAFNSGELTAPPL